LTAIGGESSAAGISILNQFLGRIHAIEPRINANMSSKGKVGENGMSCDQKRPKICANFQAVCLFRVHSRFLTAGAGARKQGVHFAEHSGRNAI
jgi:hypothetical protein